MAKSSSYYVYAAINYSANNAALSGPVTLITGEPTPSFDWRENSRIIYSCSSAKIAEETLSNLANTTDELGFLYRIEPSNKTLAVQTEKPQLIIHIDCVTAISDRKKLLKLSDANVFADANIDVAAERAGRYLAEKCSPEDKIFYNTPSPVSDASSPSIASIRELGFKILERIKGSFLFTTSEAKSQQKVADLQEAPEKLTVSVRPEALPKAGRINGFHAPNGMA